MSRFWECLVPLTGRSYDEPIAKIYWLILDGLGEVPIFAPEECLESARSILAVDEQGDLLLGDDDAVDETESNS